MTNIEQTRKATLRGRVFIQGDIVALTGLHIGGAAGALGLTLAACGGGDSTDDVPTLTVLHHTPYESADPQRIYYGVQIAHYRRLFH